MNRAFALNSTFFFGGGGVGSQEQITYRFLIDFIHAIYVLHCLSDNEKKTPINNTGL